MKRSYDLDDPREGICAEGRQGKLLTGLEPHHGHVVHSSACDPWLSSAPWCSQLVAFSARLCWCPKTEQWE